VRTRIPWVAVLAATLSACAASQPHTYGAYPELSPVVTPQPGERTPRHLTLQLARPANVAVFMVVPGRGSQLLFPVDSTQNGHVDAGTHVIETSLARLPLDTSRAERRPPPGNRSMGGRGIRDTSLAMATSGYLLVYASEQPLPYNILATKVSGISIPIEDDDALNTVTKLIRETTRTTGTWAAYATDFPP
jgi:hypothetical protein